MERIYKRSPERSFMILEGEPYEEKYEEKMLRENEVRTLLAFYTVEMDRRIQFWYDITGKRSLRDMVEQEGVTFENLERIFRYLSVAWQMIEKYLIREENVLIDPDSVFFENGILEKEAFLCYCPFSHPGLSEQIQKIMDFLISMVDHEKEDVTQLCYEMYERAQGTVSFAELLDITRMKMEGSAANEEAAFSDWDEKASGDRCIEIHALPQPEQGSMPESELEGEEKEKLSFKEKIYAWFQVNIGSRLPFGKRKKKEEEELEDFIFDPKTVLHEPTMLMRMEPQKTQFEGKLVYEGEEGEQDYLITKDKFCIGSRDEGNDAKLSSPVVSRHHARIVNREGAYYLEDLNSKNGTYVNGSLVAYHSPVKLKRMDRISFADVNYRIL